jgi:Endonuclease/Exonuclease/phosphatase family
MVAAIKMSRRSFSARTFGAATLCALLALVGVAVGSAQARRRGQPVTVMSYNIFQGSELSHSLGAKTLAQLGPAAAEDYANVIRSNIPARAQALAAEIAANQPALVGLQEAVIWRTRTPAGNAPVAIPGNATHVSYDFVRLLVRALAARGAHYRPVAITNNLDIQATGDFSGGRKMDVRYTDRVAILVRSGVAVSNPQDHNYVVHDTVSLLGAQIPVPDGWASVDVKVGGRRFRFITSHLDGLNDSRSVSVRAAEAAEILKGPANTKLPVIFTCDCNSTPGTPTHQELVAAGLRDSWAHVHPHLAGLTCCHRSSPNDPETDVADPHPQQGIVERLDYIFSRAPFALLGINLLGANPADRTHTKPRLWPSDHFGLVARFALP